MIVEVTDFAVVVVHDDVSRVLTIWLSTNSQIHLTVLYSNFVSRYHQYFTYQKVEWMLSVEKVTKFFSPYVLIGKILTILWNDVRLEYREMDLRIWWKPVFPFPGQSLLCANIRLTHTSSAISELKSVPLLRVEYRKPLSHISSHAAATVEVIISWENW